jgi:hypothetical protein
LEFFIKPKPQLPAKMQSKTANYNPLTAIIRSIGLQEDKQAYLLQQFSSFYEIASEWEKKINSIVINSVEQKTEMKMMDEARKFLKSKRVEVENTRKELKEASLREGQAIDKIAKELKGLIEPLENLAAEKARFAEIQEEKRKELLKADRLKELETADLLAFFDQAIDLKTVSDEVFQLAKKAAVQKMDEEIKRVKAEREAEQKKELYWKRIADLRPYWNFITEMNLQDTRFENWPVEDFYQLFTELEEKDRLHKAEQERIRQENEKLKAEREKIEQIQAQERAKVQAERERQAEFEAQQRAKIEAEHQAKLKAEREAREKLEAELEARRQEQARQKQLEELAAKKADEKTDKEKLITLLQQLQQIEKPIFENESLGKALEPLFLRIEAMKDYLNKLSTQL